MSKLSTQARISLIGAGPGDPELLTLKGARLLAEADVILYDALVSEEILDLAPVHATRIFVGKRAGNHRYSQDEINLLLVQQALTHGHAVRLKGGDPFVFGRGHEEMLYAQALGVPVAVVPGISSCIAVPELQGVPLTRRGYAESFWVITGTTREGVLSGDLALAARSTATVVILMGVRRLGEIAALFAAHGRDTTPAMVIRNGSLPTESCVLGTVADIAERVADSPAPGPGIIVIGDVVALHAELAQAAQKTYA